jgi:hypothetical protein
VYLSATETPILIKNKTEQLKSAIPTIDCSGLAFIPSTWVQPNKWMLSEREEAANTTDIFTSGPA